MAWQEYRRAAPVVSAGSAFISLRPGGIAFSKGFIVAASAVEAARVSLLLDEPRRRLGFRFHSKKDDADSYALVNDGGKAARRGGDARLMQGKLIYSQHPWLGDALKADPRQRRFRPQWDERAKLWFIELSPAGRAP
jgi:hypothetical protein